RGDERPGNDKGFLVRQSDRLASLQGRPGTAQASSADDRRKHPVGLRVLSHPDQAIGACKQFDPEPAQAAIDAGGRGRVGQGNEAGPEAPSLLFEGLPALPRTEAVGAEPTTSVVLKDAQSATAD